MKTKNQKLNRLKQKTAQELLDSLDLIQYLDKDLVASIPFSNLEITLFKVGRYITENELETEYENRNLIAAPPYSLFLFYKENESIWIDKKYIGTHWKDADGKWCCATFLHWYGGRRVDVDRNDHDWNDHWWFAGVRKNSSQTSESLPEALDTLPFAIETVKKAGYKIYKEI